MDSLMGKIEHNARTSFMVGSEETGRGPVTESELALISEWTRETMRRYLLLADVQDGILVLQSAAGDVWGRPPRETETTRLRHELRR